MLTITYAYGSEAPQTISLSESASPAEQTAAIQSALDAVAQNGGGTVSLSTGTFTLTGTGTASDGCLRVGSNTTFEGAATGGTVLKLADGSGSVTGIVRTDSGQTLADGSVKTTANVVIQNLAIDGNKAATTGEVDGFFCGPKPNSGAADTNITLVNVDIANCSRYGFDPHERTVGLTITDCSAHGSGVDGFVIDFASNVTITGCASYDNGRHGFNVVTSSAHVSLVDNDAWGNGGSGIVVQSGDNEIRDFTQDVSIVGGEIHDNGRYGIELRQVADIEITGVDITGNDMGGVSIAGVDGVTLTGNTITGNGGDAVDIAGYLQTFGDADPLDDVYVPTHGVIIDGVLQPDPGVPPGVAVWSWSVSDGNDVLDGTAGSDVFAAGNGDDTVNGLAGNDTIYGGDGNDRVDGGAGDDQLFGNQGDDTLVYSGGFDLLDGGAGVDTFDFSGAASAVYVNLKAAGLEAWTSGTTTANASNATTAVADLANAERLVGTTWNDTLLGNGAANTIWGDAGNDEINGDAGQDVLWGGTGADRLFGGTGNDQLLGGGGNDTLSGGSGSDRFVMGAGWGQDTVQDFSRGQDKLVFSGVAGLGGFSQLAITSVGGNAVVTFGADSVTLTGVSASSLKASDFIFE